MLFIEKALNVFSLNSINKTDITILIQGRIAEEALDFYVNNYKNYNVIISTWHSGYRGNADGGGYKQYQNHKLREVWGSEFGNWIDLSIIDNNMQESIVPHSGHIQYIGGKLREVYGKTYGDWIDIHNYDNDNIQRSFIDGKAHIEYNNGKLREAWGEMKGEWIDLKNNDNVLYETFVCGNKGYTSVQNNRLGNFKKQDLPQNIEIIENILPINFGKQNINLNIYSTLMGLIKVKTKYCIKMRGDEYYSNIDYILKELNNNSKKLHVVPVFMRKFDIWPFHMSDHLVCGLTENLLLMFLSSAVNQKNDCPEAALTRSYLEQKIPDLYWTKSGSDYKNIIKKYYNILDLQKLQPYRIVSNMHNAIFNSNFIADTSDIEDL